MKKVLFLTLMLGGLLGGRAYAQTPVDPAAVYSLSYSFERAGDYKRAAEAMAPLYRLYPRGYSLNLRLGWLAYLQGAQANSVGYYKAASSILPESFDAKLGLVLPLIALERYEEGERVLEEILKIDYFNYYANLRLSYLLRLQGKPKLALAVVNRLLPLYPSDVLVLGEWAENLVALKQNQEALRVLKDIQILDPTNLRAGELIGQLTPPPTPLPTPPFAPYLANP